MKRAFWIAIGVSTLMLSSPLRAQEPDRTGPVEEDDVRAPERSKRLTYRAGEKRPEDQLSVELFDRPLIISGELEMRARFRGNRRLDSGRPSDAVDLRPQIELEFFYPLTRSMSLFVEGKAGYSADVFQEDGKKEDDFAVRRGEMWLHVEDIDGSGFSVQVGRQNIKDKREWWWDEDLDSLRFFYEFSDFETMLTIAHELGPNEFIENETNPEFRQVLFVLSQATWHWHKRNQIDVFFVHREDLSSRQRLGDVVKIDREDRRDASLTWLGLRSRGRAKVRPIGSFHYWADVAGVWGKEIELGFDDLSSRPGRSQVDERSRFDDIRGWGLDLGVTWDIRRWLPRLTVGYAFGSGDDDPPRGKDGTFRQTGLQDNNSKFRGVDRFRYYGELLRPELSNMHIATVALGFGLFQSSSVELLYHVYRQDEAVASLRNSSLKASPTGRSRKLGQEWDLVIGLEEWEHVEIELVGSLFRAGSAFGDQEGKLATLGVIKLNYNF